MIDRRVVLMSLSALGLLGCSGKLVREPLSFDEFVTVLLPMAEASVRDGVGDQPRYLDAVAALARRVGWPTRIGNLQERLVDRQPVIITLLELAPGAAFPTHDHRGYCALMRVLSGRVIVRSYDAVTTRAEHLRIAPRPPEHLASGDIAIARDGQANIHGIESAGGALVVDIFTIYGSTPRSRRVEIMDQSTDGTFTARLGALL